MDLNDELQAQVVSLSNQLLEANVELQTLQELYRNSVKDNAGLRTQCEVLKTENVALAQRTQEMEDELADLSSGLVHEANHQVRDANRRAAATQKLVEERDNLIESLAVELAALKEILERQDLDIRTVNYSNVSQSHLEKQPQASYGQRQVSSSTGSNSLRTSAPAIPGELSHELILDLDAYATPLRPLIRTDLRDFSDFLAVWGADRDIPTSRFAKLETAPWRKPRYVQRVITEDIEPTLRLGKTPHMSWLTCRAFLNGILDQTLSLDPVSVKNQVWAQRPSQPCLLCGESRTEKIYARSYWARTTPDSEPIILDLTCVAKTRLVCELVGFLRDIARSEKPNDDVMIIKKWRQCNAMREQLFWARTGGLFPEYTEPIAYMHNNTVEDFEFNGSQTNNMQLSDPQLGASRIAIEAASGSDTNSITSHSVTAHSITSKSVSISLPLTEDLKANASEDAVKIEENEDSKASENIQMTESTTSLEDNDPEIFEDANENISNVIAGLKLQEKVNEVNKASELTLNGSQKNKHVKKGTQRLK